LSLYHQNNRITDSTYRNRFLMAIVIAQVTVILIFRFFPQEEVEIRDFQVSEREEQVLIDEIEITRQETSPPPPPRPQIPQPVPSDDIIEIELEVELDLDVPDLPDWDPGQGTGYEGDEASIVGNPQVPPTVVRIVEASAPDAVPDEYRGNLEMIVNFLVDENGDVEEASIEEIRRYTNGDYEVMPFIQYGLMDAVIRAALQWRFRPARQDGEPVRAYTRQRFNY